MSEATAGGLAPGFLVASPALRDPNFATTLVLMAEHHAQGALGFVVNRTMPITVGEVLEGVDSGLKAEAEAAGRASADAVDVVANYTAFRDLLVSTRETP